MISLKSFLILSTIVLSSMAAMNPIDDFDVEPKQIPNLYRLDSTKTKPISYDITLTPYFEDAPLGRENFTFDGTVRILIEAISNVDEIVMHMNNITITSHTITSGISNLSTVNYEHDSVTHKVRFILNGNIPMGTSVVLQIEYIGEIASDMNGFYRSSYVEGGVTKWMGTTQFQMTEARRAFPCYDEPSYKAVFRLRINRQQHLKTYSNTAIIGNSTVNERIQDIYDETPRMSSYLLAFIVSEYVNHTNSDGTFSILSRKEATTQTTYSLEYGQKILAKLETWLDYSYLSVDKITKMDMAAIPDFQAGAMENWGLLTYRETGLLYTEGKTTALAQQRIAAVITHEQAHMWFGDLVTCEWWSYTWLNEGFARYFQYFGTAMVEPTWNLAEQFVVEQLQVVFGVDALEDTHPMTYDVTTPQQIASIFDNISYNKGASVIRMMEHLIGTDNFQRALREYLRVNQFGTTIPLTLYTSLQSTIDPSIVNVTKVMSSWTTQSGYPVVSVNIINKRSIVLSQKKFMMKHNTVIPSTIKWDIPFNFADSMTLNFGKTDNFRMIQSTDSEVTIRLEYDVDWIIGNVQQTGYYRVNYDLQTWRNIATALKVSGHSGIHLINRAQIIDDVMNLARADLIDYTTAFSVFEYLKNERNYIPWLAGINNWAYIMRRFKTAQELLIARKYFIKLASEIYKTLGFEERAMDSRIDIYNRNNILWYTCVYGDTDCIRSATEEYNRFKANSSYLVPVNIRSAVYCTAMQTAGMEDWTKLWDVYLTENVATEKLLILTALGCTKNPEIIQNYLDKILWDDVRLQDKLAAFTAVYSQIEENVPIVYEYVTKNYMDIINRTLSVRTIINGLAARFNTQEQIDALTAFQTVLNAQTPPISLETAITDAEFNLVWSNKFMPQINKIVSGSSIITSFSILIIFSVILNYIL